MKRSIPKLTLKRETVRTLVKTEMERVIGGAETICPNVTRAASSCTTAFHADSLIAAAVE
jgi:hypothetical protein